MQKTFCDECEKEFTEEDIEYNASPKFKSMIVNIELSNGLAFRGLVAPDNDKATFCKSCRVIKNAEKDLSVKNMSLRLSFRDPILLKIN